MRDVRLIESSETNRAAVSKCCAKQWYGVVDTMRGSVKTIHCVRVNGIVVLLYCSSGTLLSNGQRIGEETKERMTLCYVFRQ